MAQSLVAVPQTSSERMPSNRLLAAEAAVVGVAMAAVYLLLMAGSHNEGYDGIGYMAFIRAGDPDRIFQPYHVLFNWLGWSAYNVALHLGYDGGPLRPVQVMNSLLGGVGVALLWVLLRRAGLGRVGAAGGAGILACSYGYWGYSEDIELYTLSTTLLILTLLTAHRAAMRPSASTFAAFGAANGLAILGHNTAAMFGVVAMAALWFASRTQSVPGVLRCLAAYVAAGALVVVPAYTVAIPVVGIHTPREFYDWMTAAAQDTTGGWGHFSPGNLPRAVIGFSRALMGGHFALSLPLLHDFVRDHFQDKNLRTELFLSRDFNHVAAVALLAVAACAGVALIVIAAGWLRRPRLQPPARMLGVLCVAWIVPYAIFFTWWDPVNLKFWIALWVPVATLLVLPLSSVDDGRWRRFGPSMLAVVIAGLLVVNLFGSVLPQTQRSNDYWRARTDWYASHTTSQDVIFTSTYLHAEYLRYFTKAEVVDLRLDIVHQYGEDHLLEQVQRIIDESPGKRILFSSEAVYPGDDPYSHCIEPNCTIGEQLRGAYLSKLRQIADEPLEQVWQLERK